MSTNERDTHFQGFATLLWDEISSEIFALSTEENGVNDGCFVCNLPEAKVAEALAPLIARHAFDFADHVIKHLHGSNLNEIQDMGLERFLREYGEQIGYERVPDMDKWPE